MNNIKSALKQKNPAKTAEVIVGAMKKNAVENTAVPGGVFYQSLYPAYITEKNFLERS